MATPQDDSREMPSSRAIIEMRANAQ